MYGKTLRFMDSTFFWCLSSCFFCFSTFLSSVIGYQALRHEHFMQRLYSKKEKKDSRHFDTDHIRMTILNNRKHQHCQAIHNNCFRTCLAIIRQTKKKQNPNSL